MKEIKNIMDLKSVGYRVRFAIFSRDDFKCRYCGKSGLNGHELEIDHIIPVTKFEHGYWYKEFHTLNSDISLVTSCYECNKGKLNNLIDVNIVEELMKENEKRRDKYEKFGSIDIKQEYGKLEKNRDLIKALIKWLNKEGNSETKIADHLGYNSSVAIYQWLKRGRIPFHQIDAVENFIKTKGQDK
jgi:hypothetical protein